MIKYYLLIAAVVFVIFLYNTIMFRKNEKKKLMEKIRNNWGKFPKREYSFDEFLKITYNYQKHSKGKFVVDDITWNDLNMDEIFKLINNTYSSAGEEYLYKMLRLPVFEKEELEKREALIKVFENSEDDSVMFQEIFAKLGRTKKISLSEFLDKLSEVKRQGNLIHYFCSLLFVAAVVLLFVSPVAGIFAFLAMLIFNIGIYYKKKRDVDCYFICFKYLIDMIICTEKIVEVNISGVEEYTKRLKESLEKIKGIKKGSFLISMNGNSGSLGEIIMEYIRMIFHVDIIKFNKMTETVVKHGCDIENMFEILGKIESSMAVASFRKALKYYCIPKFSKERTFDIEEIYHPLISNPVTNDIKENRSVLLTGSNASGKSTFLKTIAINSILAQTIFTCTAKKYVSCFFKVFTSMALRDDLSKNESYFMVEIKSLKRIIDAVETDIPVLCFVDEVLRGTNTIERISASSHILEYISRQNVFCFAATHDIELTNILDGVYSNYHFTEKVKDDDVLFDYKLFKGRAVSRNAIKLLKVIGFDSEIINNAEKMAETFTKEGEWVTFKNPNEGIII